MIEGKSFYFHGTVVTIRTQEQRMKNQSNYNRQSEQKEIYETKLIIIQSKNMQTATSAGRRESPSRYWF